MSESNRKRCQARKNNGLCIYCGVRPQFWGVRCIICRQIFVKNRQTLPAVARRALRLYREAERQLELEQRQVHARFAARKLLAAGDLNGNYARALRLYAGLDRGGWRTYQEVGQVMHLSRERVRQLLQPAKLRLTEMLGRRAPWPPPPVKTPRPAARKRPLLSHPVPNTRSPLDVQPIIA